MIKRYYAEVDGDGNVIQTLIVNDPDEGPPQLPETEFDFYPVAGPLDWNPPSSTSVKKWVNGSDVWVETADLLELKTRKNAEINAARLAANRSYFEFNGKRIACDELSRSDIDAVNGLVSVIRTMPPNWVGGWKTMDNSYVPIPDVATWINFYVAMVQKGSSNFDHAQSLKAQLALAATSEAIDAISW